MTIINGGIAEQVVEGGRLLGLGDCKRGVEELGDAHDGYSEGFDPSMSGAGYMKSHQ